MSRFQLKLADPVEKTVRDVLRHDWSGARDLNPGPTVPNSERSRPPRPFSRVLRSIRGMERHIGPISGCSYSRVRTEPSRWGKGDARVNDRQVDGRLRRQ